MNSNAESANNPGETAGQTSQAAGRATSYNTGKPEDKRHALDAISDYVKTLLSIATGSVALSATFLKDLYTGRSLHLLIWAWGLLGGSVFLGLIAMGAVIDQLAASNFRPRRSGVELWALLQFLTILAGLGLFAWFAVRNVSTS